MAIKPTEIPIPLATDAAYDFEVWPVGHTLEGQETPWSLQPTKDPAAEAAMASKGWQPGKRVFAPGLNSRGSKVDAMLAWSFAGTPASSPNTVVERDVSGDSRFAGVSLEEGPWSRYSHEEVSAWQQNYRVAHRTYVAEGVVPGASGGVHDITRPGDDRYFFDAFPTNCAIFFHYDVMAWVGTGDFEPLNVASIFSRRGQTFGQKVGAVYDAGGLQGTPNDALFGPSLSLFPFGVAADRVEMRGSWDPALVGKLYRVVSDVSIRVIELDVP